MKVQLIELTRQVLFRMRRHDGSWGTTHLGGSCTHPDLWLQNKEEMMHQRKTRIYFFPVATKLWFPSQKPKKKGSSRKAGV